MRRIIITLIFFFLFSLSFGQGMFELNSQEDNLLNQPFIQEIIYYKDSTNKLTLADLSNKKFEKINSYTSATFNKDFTYWFKINLVNKSEESKLWFFEVLDPHIQYINVYQISDGDTIRFNPTGFKIPFSSRFSNHKNFIFPIRFHNSDSTLLYFSFKNNYYSNLTVSLRPAKKFIDYALNEYYLLGIFYGILLIMATYNFSFFSQRGSECIYIM